MNTRTIAVVAVFAALAVALNPFKVPAPYAPFLYYQIWEIPIITAFLLFGPKIGVATAVLNTAALFVLFPGALPTGPIYNLVAVLGMLSGVYSAHQIVAGRSIGTKEAAITLASTTLGAILRVVTMSFVNWAFIRYPPPIGFSMPEDVVTALLPAIGFFNATLALYTIPAGYVLARAVGSGIKAKMWIPRA